MSQVAPLRSVAWSAAGAGRARARSRRRPWSRQKSLFAFEIFVVQIVAIAALQTALQLHVTHELAQTASIDTAELLRDLFFDALRTLMWIGPLIALTSVLVALRMADRFMASGERVRRALAQLADGDPGVRLRLGEGDALEAMEADFNRLAERFTQRRRERGDADPTH